MSRTKFVCIDGHTCGNPVRVVTEGHPNLVGVSMSEKRQDFLENFDWIRKEKLSRDEILDHYDEC